VPKKDLKGRDRTDFINEVKNIIRDPKDMSSKKRTMNTPAPDIIVSKIRAIIDNPRWKERVPYKAFKELNNLCLHAEKGCLRYYLLKTLQMHVHSC
jgi:hypothetical protein